MSGFADDYFDSDRLACDGYVDIHCHCLPGIDDGPAMLSESL